MTATIGVTTSDTFSVKGGLVTSDVKSNTRDIEVREVDTRGIFDNEATRAVKDKIGHVVLVSSSDHDVLLAGDLGNGLMLVVGDRFGSASLERAIAISSRLKLEDSVGSGLVEGVADGVSTSGGPLLSAAAIFRGAY